jgi:hypothetical protein
VKNRNTVYTPREMPNQRAPGQKLLNFPVSEEFIGEIDKGVAKSGLGDRSKFIRAAIQEKLKRLGIEVPVEVWAAPPRARENREEPERASRRPSFPPVNSAVEAAAKGLLEKAVAEVRRPPPKSPR